MSDPVLEFSFAGGFDESARPETMDAAQSFTLLENIRQDKTGGANKRNGFAALSATRLDGTTRSTGARMFTRGDQLCTIDASAFVDTYSETAARSIVQGRVPEASCKLHELASFGPASYVEDVVAVNGYLAISIRFIDAASNHLVMLVDAAGAIILPAHLLAAETSLRDCRVAAYGVYALAFSCCPDSNIIRVNYLDTTSESTISAGWQAMTSLTDFNSSSGFDCSNMASNDRVALAFSSNSATKIVVKTLNVSGAIQSVDITTAHTIGANGGLGLSEGGDTLWVAFADAQVIKAVGLNPSTITSILASSLSIETLISDHAPKSVFVCPRTSAGTASVYVMVWDTTIQPGWLLRAQDIKTSAGAAATDGTLRLAGGAFMQSRPFLRGGRIYARFDSEDGGFGDTLCDATVQTVSGTGVWYMRPVAAPIQRGDALRSISMRCRAAVVDTSRYMTGLVIRQSGNTHGFRLVEYNFGDPNRWRPAMLNGSLFLSGGVTTEFDGLHAFEMGFLVAPRMPQVNASTGSGTTFTNGRCYVATYQQVDADGRWHVSGVSLPSEICGAVSDKTVGVYTSPLSVTSRAATGEIFGTTQVVFYGTLDANNGQPPYHRIGGVTNSPGLSYVGVVDGLDDATLASQELLYDTGDLPATDGSGQDHRSPVGWNHMVSYNGMLVGAQGATFYWTAQNIDGEGVWTSPVFASNVEDEITGVAVQDGAVLIFTATGIWATSGDPPSDNGQQGGLATPRRIAVDIGGRPLVTTSKGTFYVSARGIELFTRSQASMFIGAKVQDTFATYPVVTAAVLDMREARSLVRFSLATEQPGGLVDTSANQGADLVFDIDAGIWQSRDLKYGAVAGQATQDACIVTLAGVRRYCWLGADGIVYVQKLEDDATACLDGGTWATMKAVTPWVHIAGINGEQFIDQLLLLAKRSTLHQIAIALAFDYSDTFGTAKVFTDTQITSLVREWLIKEVEQTTSTAVRAMIYDVIPDGISPVLGTGAGGTWLAVTLNGQPHRGPKRSSGAQRGG